MNYNNVGKITLMENLLSEKMGNDIHRSLSSSQIDAIMEAMLSAYEAGIQRGREERA